jgi:hypothetical protein
MILEFLCYCDPIVINVQKKLKRVGRLVFWKPLLILPRTSAHVLHTESVFFNTLLIKLYSPPFRVFCVQLLSLCPYICGIVRTNPSVCLWIQIYRDCFLPNPYLLNVHDYLPILFEAMRSLPLINVKLNQWVFSSVCVRACNTHMWSNCISCVQ